MSSSDPSSVEDIYPEILEEYDDPQEAVNREFGRLARAAEENADAQEELNQIIEETRIPDDDESLYNFAGAARDASRMLEEGTGTMEDAKNLLEQAGDNQDVNININEGGYSRRGLLTTFLAGAAAVLAGAAYWDSRNNSQQNEEILDQHESQGVYNNSAAEGTQTPISDDGDGGVVEETDTPYQNTPTSTPERAAGQEIKETLSYREFIDEYDQLSSEKQRELLGANHKQFTNGDVGDTEVGMVEVKYRPEGDSEIIPYLRSDDGRTKIDPREISDNLALELLDEEGY